MNRLPPAASSAFHRRGRMAQALEDSLFHRLAHQGGAPSHVIRRHGGRPRRQGQHTRATQ